MRQEQVMVSIYCKAYNHEKYIRQCLDGFVGQETDFRYEIVIHDDASTDRTAEIIREYEAKYPDLMRPIYQTENQYSQRVPVFTKFMLPVMKGKYIACCEGDDYWTDPHKLQRQVDFLESHEGYSACVHNTMVKNMTNGKEFLNYPEQDRDLGLEDVIKGGMACYHTSSLMYPRRFAENRPAFLRMQKGVGDYPMSIYLALEGTIHYFGDCMSVYRFGGTGSWTKKLGDDAQKKIKNLTRQIDMLRAADEYSEGRRHEVFEEQIARTEFEMALEKDDIQAIRSPEYRRFYNEYTFKHKVMVNLRHYCPPLYAFLMRYNKFYVKGE
ncbi:MAG: glycosyltransferase [Clostridia bacterium]|nr:glycosyltransferase [Clostridia bacterium]